MHSEAPSVRPRVVVAGILPPSVGGITSFLLEMMSSSLAEDFELIPFNTGRPHKPNVTNNTGYRALWNAGIGRMLRAIVVTLKHVLTFPWLLWKSRPSLIHLHTSPYWSFWESAVYLLEGRLAGVPCVLQFHFSFRAIYEKSSSLSRRLMLWVVRRSRVFVVICHEDLKFLDSLSRASALVVYVPNGVDVRRIQSEVAAARRKDASGEGSPEVLFLGGSETVRKGLPELLQAVPALVSRFPGLRFRLLAVPGDIVRLHVPAELRDACLREDWVSGTAKYAFFRPNSIFVLPSHGEGMPIAILEAMAAGLPIVASAVGGIPDLIRDGEEGLLLRRIDAPSIVDAVAKLRCSPRLGETLGANARRRVESHFDVVDTAERFKETYRLALGLRWSLPDERRAASTAAR
ncbi:MAG TPA: glycosyltransferase family 4 protein [Vicinamibacteria bacterium]|nr:glycosyltransferase family 4 protein [Vicinamibacteria bacterium]